MMILRVGLGQIVPEWLNRDATLEKILDYAEQAAEEGCQLVAFGEALLPGYPFWVELTDGARFESAVQKELFAHYVRNAVDIDGGDLESLCEVASRKNIAVYLGCIERAADRGGHSLYCSLVYINQEGSIESVHRKLCPTYEERLVWSPGDGHGLQVHPLEGFHVGGLNCWENWMPLARTALYGQGENVHVSVWPGSERNTRDITRFVAKESRSYMLSVSGLLHRDWIPENVPYGNDIRDQAPEWIANGGSCIAGPDGEWLVEPVVGEEVLIIAELSLEQIYRERQNFDAVGHYSRPDVTQLSVDRKRQSCLKIKDA